MNNNSNSWLIVGLGNPEIKYHNTPHNAGFATLDALCQQLKIKLRPNLDSLIGKTTFNQKELFFLKPQTYMNSSGLAIKKALVQYDIPLSNFIVIQDDVDLPLSKLRIKQKGRPGGHNGIKSIIEQLQTDAFLRLKIGVGRPPQGTSTYDYVLRHLQGEHLKALQLATQKAAQSILILISQGLEQANLEINKGTTPPNRLLY